MELQSLSALGSESKKSRGHRLVANVNDCYLTWLLQIPSTMDARGDSTALKLLQRVSSSVDMKIGQR